MTFKDGGNIGGDASAGGSGGGGRGGLGRGTVIGGGGIGGLIILAIAYFLGVNPGDITGGTDTGAQPQQQSGAVASYQQHLQSCTFTQANSDTGCRIVATQASLNAVWPELIEGYQKPAGIVVMPSGSESVNSGCGIASADTGPFYCPRDQKAYFQIDFMDSVLTKMGGSNAPFSQEYVVAHEFGHHIQNLLGDLSKAQQSAQGADSGSVRVELQADCYAGVWAAHADKGENALLEPLTQQDISEAITSAKAIGDDTIQSNSGAGVNPESWTHGSSAQRVKWFTTGYKTGDPNRCDTFSGAI